MKQINTDEDIVAILNEFFLDYKESQERWWSYGDIEKWWLKNKDKWIKDN